MQPLNQWLARIARACLAMLAIGLLLAARSHAGTLPSQTVPTWNLDNPYWNVALQNLPHFSSQSACNQYALQMGYSPGGTTEGWHDGNYRAQCPLFDQNGNQPWWAPVGLIRWQPGSPRCPDPNASLDPGNGTCTCKSGYDQAPGDNQSCYRLEEVNRAEAPPPCEKCYGNPIYPLRGVKREVVRTGQTLRGFELLLTYDSAQGLRPQALSRITMLEEPNSFGALWRSNLHRKLHASVSGARVLLSRGNGEVLTFVKDGAGNFVPDGGRAIKLASITDGYRFTDVAEGIIETYGLDGTLRSLARIDGAVLTFTYSAGNLASVGADDGRAISFAYTGNKISAVTGTDGLVTTFAYDGNGNLTSITWPDTKSRGFVYENSSFPWALTGIIDENGERYSTFSYDSAGRAIGTQHANGVDSFTVSYAEPPQWVVTDQVDWANKVISRTHSWRPPQGLVVTRPNGDSTSLEVASVLGMPSPTSESQSAGSGSNPGAILRTYDTNGNIDSYVDATGSKRCSVHDALNREVLRVEGLAGNVACSTVSGPTDPLPAGARRTITTWHPDWKLPLQVLAPLRKTTYVYHGQPDPFNANAVANCTAAAAMPGGQALPVLCKQVEQALSPTGAVDASVPDRGYIYTYDASGRVTSSVDPRSKATTLAYASSTTFETDPHFARVVLLAHGDGAEASTTFIDSSLSQKPLTPTGSGPAIRTAQSKFGGASLGFNGAAPLGAGQSPDWTFTATDDYTVEFWFYRTAGSGSTACMVATNGGNRWSFFWRGSTNKAAVYCANCGSFMESTTTLQLNTWYHYALTKQGTTFRLFVNGVLETTATTNQATDPSNVSMNLGGGFGGEYFTGYIDDVRITKGVARYTATFTPPARAYFDPASFASQVGMTAGDLQSVTNPAGQVTQYLAYSRSGQVRQLRDAKGNVTETTYTPRGWTHSVTVTPPGMTPRTTTYQYDGVGQVTGLSLPDGTSLTYTYDASQRLTGVTDARGNSITYTLDAAGNRTGEEVRDSTGTLRRSIARSFDALGRVQQVTGGAQ